MRSTSRMRSLRALAIAAAGAGLVLAGCSGGTSTQSSESSPSGAEAAAGGTLTVASPYAIESLDPHGAMGVSSGTSLAERAIYTRLVGVDEDGTITPDLATEWTPNDDATEWTFTLRDAKFSDGTALTSADVVASFERAEQLAGPVAGNFKDVTASAPDDKTVVLTSTSPDTALPAKTSLLYMASKDATDADFNEPLASGPFKVESFTPGETLTLIPNENYYGDQAKLDKLVIRSIPEISARIAALQSGEIQATWGVPDDQLAGIESDTDIHTELVPATSEITMWFNSGRDTFKDAAVRKALWQAVDFKTIISTLFPETGELADSVIPETVFGYAPQAPVTYDPDAAKAALENAGFDFSQKIEIQYSGAEYRQFIQAVSSDFQKIGVNVVPNEKENAVFTDDLLAMNWDINFQALSTPTHDAATNLGRLYTCAAGRTGYCNEDLDKHLAEAGANPDEDARKDAYAQAIDIIWNDAVGMYPMTLKIAYAWTSGVEGIVPSGSFVPDFSQATVR